MGHRWTTEQQSAIEARGSNLLVSAGAGSGKTAVLVSRILGLILEEAISVDRLLVVTFTKAAAGEMKERLRRELNSRRAADPAAAQKVQEQLQRLNHAWITTFHGFCRQLLQRHFQEAGLEPRFRVLDSVEADALRRQAVTQVLEAAYETADPAFISWVECYSGNRTDQRLEDMILDLHSFLLSRPDPWEWSEQVQRLYREPLDESHPWVRQASQRRIERLKEALELLEEAAEIALDPEGPTEYVPAVHDDIRQTETLLEAASGTGDWSEAVAALSRQRLSPVGKKRKEELSPIRIDLVKDLREEAWGILKALADKADVGTDVRSRMELIRAGEAGAVLADLVMRFDGAYGALKSTAGAVDYGDLEHKALRLLKIETIRETYRRHFRYLFIDEYQDSNGVQEALLKAIESPGNRFMVGDVKQSIYRFRLAEPGLFVGRLAGSSPEPGAPDRRIDLNRNFRSRSEIIETINAVFSRVMSAELGDVDYRDGARLTAGAAYPPDGGERISVTVLGPPAGVSDDGDEGAEYTAAELEARAVGTHILRVVGTPIWDVRSETWRPAAWEDIAVLLRAVRPWRNTLGRVFDELGIPLSAEGGASGEEAWEVHLLIHLLRLIGNSRQDLPMMVVMRSPLGGFTIEDLAAVRQQCPDMAFQEAVRQEQALTPDLRERLNALLGKVARWQEQCRTVPLGDFLWNLCETEGLRLYCQAMPGGAARRERLHWAVRQADQLSRLGGDTPEALADHLQALTERGELPSLPEEGAGGGVRIMSIHKSKGLEFPIVFLTGLGKRFNTADLREEVLRHRELGFGLRYVDAERRIRRGTLVTDLIQDAVRRENLSEELRILYVGMTRAMDHLHLYGTAGRFDKQFDTWIKGPERYFMKSARCYLDWILPPLLAEADILEAWSGAREIGAGTARLQMILCPETLQREVRPASTDTVEEEKPAVELKGWPWRYPWEAETRVPSKLTVTELNRLSAGAEEQAAAAVQPTEAGRRDGAMTGAELGTLHHLVLQHLTVPAQPDEEALTAALTGLLARNIISGDDLAAIRQEWLIRFFRSSLGRRIAASDRVLREVPFVVLRDYRSLGGDAAGDVMIQGVVDCCFREAGGWVLVDYKTDGGSNPEATVKKYGTQLKLYAEAVEELTGEPVAESWLYLMRTGTAVEMKNIESS